MKHWRTETIRERQDDFPSYEAELEFPVFTDAVLGLADLNVLQRSDALRRLSDFRTLRLVLTDVDHGPLSKLSSILTSSYEISCYSADIISIRHSIFHYGAGAAHPNHATAVTNLRVEPLIPLYLGHIFKRDSPYLKTISDYCVSRLTEDKGLDQPSEWILKGAGPDLRNFSKFNITPLGLLVTFDEYEVDCYAAGGSQVLIARSLLLDYVNPLSSVKAIWLDTGKEQVASK